MLTETTVSKLRETRLIVMANTQKDQLADSQFHNMAFVDQIGLLVDAEWNAYKNNHLHKLLRQATFSDPGACLENVEYLPDRGLTQEEPLRFIICNYIQDHHNIILFGATGIGKTYLACTLGMPAVRQFYAVKYIRLPDLLLEFQITSGNGTIFVAFILLEESLIVECSKKKRLGLSIQANRANACPITLSALLNR